jgi:ABC-type multidrug transport system fused ATPase/permease subunit
VKVIDSDTFPTNRFNDVIKKRGIEGMTQGDSGVKPVELLIEYFKLNYNNQAIKNKTLATLAIGQLQNLYFLLTVNLLKYVADDVLAQGANPALFLVPNSLQGTLLVVGALYLVPYGLLNGLDIWKAQLGLPEISKAYLRQNMFRKFMNYNGDSRDKVPSSKRVMAMTSDVNDVVESGYMKALEIVQITGKLGVSSFFILQENPEGLGPIVIFTLAIAGFVATMGDESVRVQDAISEQEGRIVATVQDSAAKYRLIADYLMRPMVQDRLERNVQELTKASIPAATLECVNEYYPGWLANVLTATYIVYGGQQVVEGNLQIGAFLATSGVIKDVGESFKDIFTSLLSISKAVEPLQDMTVFMNLPTDLRGNKKVNRQRRRRTKLERSPDRLAELRRRSGTQFATDAIPISIEGVSFSYPGATAPAIEHFQVSVPQGNLVAVVGPRREGKSTVMRLLGLVVTPSEGEIFVPAHLRILHVSQNPILLDATPWENLAFGKQYWKDAEFESLRVIKICKRLGLQPALVRHLEDTRLEFLEKGRAPLWKERWVDSLSSSDAALIHIGRAFIYNPEVLVIHRPTLLLSLPTAEIVLGMLREFVDRRGVELPLDTDGRRRPRTAFASFARNRGVELADVVWGVRKGIVSEIAKPDVSDLLLA